MDNLFNLETDVDVKEYTKVRCKAVLNDTIMFRIECYNLNKYIYKISTLINTVLTQYFNYNI